MGGETAQVHGHPAAGGGLFQLILVRLESSDAAAFTAGHQLDLLPHGQSAVDEGAGNHRPESGYTERAVDGQARAAQVAALLRGIQGLVDGGEQLIQTTAGGGGDRQDGRSLQRRSLQRVIHLQLDQLKDVLLHQVALGDDRQASPDAEQVQDGQVLLGLGHDRLIGGDHQQRQVDAAHAGEHVLDEPLVAGDVHDAHLPAAGRNEPREAQVDGKSALLLLLKSVRVNASQRLDEGGLAMVYVARGPNDVHGASIARASVCPTRARQRPHIRVRCVVGGLVISYAHGWRACATSSACHPVSDG